VKVSHLAVALLLAVAAPSHALFDKGNVGLPDDSPGLEPVDPVPPPPPPPVPPINVHQVGFDFIEVSVRPPAGRLSQLFR